MCEHQLALYGSGANASIKTLDAALHYILQCREALFTLTETERERDKIDGREVGNRNTAGNVMEENDLTDEQKEEVTGIERKRDRKEEEIEDTRNNEKATEQKDFTNEQGDKLCGFERRTNGKNEGNAKEIKIEDETNDRKSPEKMNPTNEEETMKYPTRTDKDGITIETFNARFSKELNVLIPILETRLNFVLKEMVKLRSTKKTSKNKDLNVAEFEKVKHMYSVALRGCVGNSKEDIFQTGRRIAKVLAQINDIKLNS